MTWDVSYRKAGQFRILFTTIEGENELTARLNFHQKFNNVFIKTICQKGKELPISQPLTMPKSNTSGSAKNGMN